MYFQKHTNKQTKSYLGALLVYLCSFPPISSTIIWSQKQTSILFSSYAVKQTLVSFIQLFYKLAHICYNKQTNKYKCKISMSHGLFRAPFSCISSTIIWSQKQTTIIFFSYFMQSLKLLASFSINYLKKLARIFKNKQTNLHKCILTLLEYLGLFSRISSTLFGLRTRLQFFSSFSLVSSCHS